ncbi:MAG: T9SS type A sorting domain-containing protein [Candidatus Cloacimonetes bacterium]|nr:T9SS type A sorting domain-containing protein [Candidatus Cloacimonadota bacterium]
MKRYGLLILIMALPCLVLALTLSVKQDGTGDYTLIQEAITASTDGDTVLVYPGRYYENVRFNGKSITLASLEILTGDRNYIHSTIIDANHQGVGIYVADNEYSIHIQGFTVINGSGHYNDLYDWYSGGGIAVSRMSGQRQAQIINCHVTENQADNGAGVYLGYCHAYLSGVSIHHNTGGVGSGIYFAGSQNQYNATFDSNNRCNIYSNYAAFGSDLYFYNVNSVHVVVDTFTVANPWNFYATAVAASPSITNPYTFDILHTVHEEVNHDLYVAPWGDNANSGLSSAEPMQSIFMAMYRIASDPDNPKTVHVADGHYSPSLNNQLFPIPIKSYTTLKGESRKGTILDAELHSDVINASQHNENWSAQSLSLINGVSGLQVGNSHNSLLSDLYISGIRSPYIATGLFSSDESGVREYSNIVISDVKSTNWAKGITNHQSSGQFSLKNVEITGCEALEMRAILISTVDECDVIIDGCEVHDNRSSTSEMYSFNTIFQISPYEHYGTRLGIEIKNSAFYDNYQGTSNVMGMARSLNDTLFISNCTFAGNSGGSGVIAVQGTNVLTNNIFYNPEITTQILIPNHISSGIYSPTTLINNNILGGSAGVYSQTSQNPVYWGEGNTMLDPGFTMSGNRPYTLDSTSPLIDMGWQSGSLMDQSLDAGGNERYWDGDGDGITRIDVGAYEYQPVYAPANLQAEQWQQQIQLSWQMPRMDRGLAGFRIYRNGEVYVNIMEPSARAFRDYSAVNDTITYYLVALYGSVESTASNSVMVIIDCVTNQDAELVPVPIRLSSSPNPFRELAVITYQLEAKSEVELKIYNLRGQLVKHLYSSSQDKGDQVLAWEGCDDCNRELPAGVYLLRLSIDGKMQKPLKLLKL